MNNDPESLELAIEATTTDDLLRIIGIDRPRYGETLIAAAEEELNRRGHATDEQERPLDS
ncbi:MAG: hypothetical protein LC803_09960 [Acidobacteria bacterium]|nr:hypothetical protein [Acidobacteriota bacterium]